MRTLTVLNEKGGVGKTTCAQTIAAGLAIREQHVLLIDADPQGKCADGFGLESAPHFHDFVIRKTSIDDLIVEVPRAAYRPDDGQIGSLHLMPGNVETRSINDGTSDLLVLLKKLAALRDRFDVVVIDSQPTPALLHSVIFLASDGVIFPTELTRSALLGVGSTWANLQENNAIRTARGLPPVELFGIVPMRTRLNTKIQAKHLRDLGDVKFFESRVWEPIAWRVVWEEAASNQESIFAYAPDSEEAATARRLVQRVEGALYGEG